MLLLVVLAILLGAGRYNVERYWSPAGSEVVETREVGVSGAGGMAAAVLALVGVILLFLGFTQWNWFGTSAVAPGNHQQSRGCYACSSTDHGTKRPTVAFTAGVTVAYEVVRSWGAVLGKRAA